jgi:branched-subunit amino acid aminotransferase/4-amino-4-deoxychorismate lyase
MSPKRRRRTSSWSRTARSARRPPTARSSSGITRARTIALLAEDGIQTVEKALSVRDFLEADEIFSTGNHSKVVPVTRIEDRNLQPGPIAKKARELYWDWAHSTCRRRLTQNFGAPAVVSMRARPM